MIVFSFYLFILIMYILHFTPFEGFILESIIQVEHEVKALCIELLGVLLEVIGTFGSSAFRSTILRFRNTVVASALLVSASGDVAAIGQIA